MDTTLEQRVQTLERQMRQILLDSDNGAQPKDWEKVVGMFDGDEFMKEVFEEALKYREADRARARRRFRKKTRIVK